MYSIIIQMPLIRAMEANKSDEKTSNVELSIAVLRGLAENCTSVALTEKLLKYQKGGFFTDLLFLYSYKLGKLNFILRNNKSVSINKLAFIRRGCYNRS
jgi:hypothetical protein